MRDISFIQDPPNPENKDGKHDIANRHLGAFGFPAPYGHAPLDYPRISFNIDIVGGSVGTLCDAYRSITKTDEAGHWVNLLFDHETENIKIESPYTHDNLTVTIKNPKPLFVRLPSWLSPENIASDQTPCVSNGFLVFPDPPINEPLSLKFELSGQTLTLKHRTRNIQVQTKGDCISAMDNFGADLIFFDTL